MTIEDVDGSKDPKASRNTYLEGMNTPDEDGLTPAQIMEQNLRNFYLSRGMPEDEAAELAAKNTQDTLMTGADFFASGLFDDE